MLGAFQSGQYLFRKIRQSFNGNPARPAINASGEGTIQQAASGFARDTAGNLHGRLLGALIFQKQRRFSSLGQDIGNLYDGGFIHRSADGFWVGADGAVTVSPGGVCSHNQRCDLSGSARALPKRGGVSICAILGKGFRR